MRINNDSNNTGFVLDRKEGPYNSGKVYEYGNMGHRPAIKGGYFPVPPAGGTGKYPPFIAGL